MLRVRLYIHVHLLILVYYVPPISKTCTNLLFDRSFVYAAPTLWNALDLDIRLLPFNPFATEFAGLVVRNYFWCQF